MVKIQIIGVLAGPKALMTDGPYVEAEDLIGGYIVISAENLDEASEIARLSVPPGRRYSRKFARC
jgi:hypothetical protein